MKFHNYNDADKTYLGLAVAFFALGIGFRFFWIPAVLFFLVAFLKNLILRYLFYFPLSLTIVELIIFFFYHDIYKRGEYFEKKNLTKFLSIYRPRQLC